MKTKTKQKPKLAPVVKPVYFNDCYWCDSTHRYYPDLSAAAVKRVCLSCSKEAVVKPGPSCMCTYWTNVRGRTVEEAKSMCLKCCRPADVQQPVFKPVPVFDLNAFIASFPPLPRFQWGGDADWIAAGMPRIVQNGPSFPQTAIQGRGIPPLPLKRKEGHVLEERRPVAVPAIADKPDTRTIGTLPVVERDGKKPKIVLCGQRFGLSYIFLWMGCAGWSHNDLEVFCDKLDIELPSSNTTQSRLRAGKQNNPCYGIVPRLSKKQAELMSNTITKRRTK